MRVLGFGTYDVERHPRIGILLDGLRERGADVTHLNVPLGFSTGERIEMVRRPWLAYRLALRLVRCWWRLAHGARQRRGRRFDVVLVGYLGQFDVLLARLLFPRRLIVLDQLVFGADTADDRGLGRAAGGRRRLLALIDSAASAVADIVVVDTIENRDLLAAGRRAKAVVIPVGAPHEWFEAGTERATNPDRPLQVVFFGLFTPLQGTTVIAQSLALLAGRPDIEVTMIGSGQQRDQAHQLAAANPHVRWIDWVPPADLPGTVAAHDVCLGIFGTGSKAWRVVPNKVYQGAAAGCALVTSDTAPQRSALHDAALFVAPGNAPALAAALRRLAADRAQVAHLGALARTRALEAFTAVAVVEPLFLRLSTECS